MRAHHVVPDLVLLTAASHGIPDHEYVSRYGLNLGYRLAVRRPKYALLVRPFGQTSALVSGAWRSSCAAIGRREP
jgi:hypothetical protein